MYKGMKKIVSLLLVLIMLITLVSCGGQAAVESGEDTGSKSTGGKDTGTKQTEPVEEDNTTDLSGAASTDGPIEN